MNVKKLSLASLFLVLSCSFGWAQETTEVEEISNENATFVKMESLTQLVPGNKFLFICSSRKGQEGVPRAMAVLQGNKRNGTEVEIINSDIDDDMELIECEIVNDAPGTPCAFTLGYDEGKGYTFYDEVAGGYLQGPNNNGNTMYVAQTINDRCYFTIEYTEDGDHFIVRSADQPDKTIQQKPSGEPEFICSSDDYVPAYLFVQYSSEVRITLARSNGGDDLNYYATVFFDKDMKLDKNIAAYDVVPVPTTTETQELTLEEVVAKGEILYANSPVILMLPNEDPEAAPYVDYPIYTLATTTPDMTIETHLQGTLEDIDAPENSFKLRKQAVEDETGEEVGTVAFFKAEGTSILANKAYYVLGEAAEEGEETGEVKVLTFSFSGATGIEKVNTPQEVNNGAIYNLAGQQVNKNYRGIVLKNGKKFLNK